MEWTQREDEAWVLNGPGGASDTTLGVVRYRDGSWWGELQPTAGAAGSLEEPAQLSEEQFEASLASLPEPLGPFDSADEARSAVEHAAGRMG